MAQLKQGKYFGTITDIYLKEYPTSKGTSFKKIIIEVDIILDKEEYDKTGKSSLKNKNYQGNPDFTKEYFEQIGLTSETCIGKLVQVTLQKETFKNQDNERINTLMIKFLNFLDENGNVIMSNKVLEKQAEKKENKKLDF